MHLRGLVVLIISGLIVAFSNFFIWLIVTLVRQAAKCLRNHLPWWFRWDITLSTITLVIETTSAALEQASPHKMKAAECGVIMATVCLILLFADLVYKRYSDSMPHYLDCNFADILGLFSSLLTLISASIHYNYISNGKQQPIRFSMMPLAFSVCVFCSCVFRRSTDKLLFTMRCKHLGPMNLQIEMGGKLYRKVGPTQFGCSICQIGQMHPRGV
ncbi:uncharacterized protein LOC110634409 [Hevea brasiliensis]|uniref:uncharacterized protein LOC110634409 n=1 Tax=Hevea brasiliensis TaxID=3981 RepID=UPI0026000F9F|nr:uncharacterized protein LOC110634409 [Hevea brasiliensis]